MKDRMAREYVGDLWMEKQEDGRVRLGFARRFIEDRLGECFHVMQADTQSVKKGGPLLVIETNDGLRTLKSPLAGSILRFDAKARNFPDKLLEDDTILEVLPQGVKLPAPKKAEEKTKPAFELNWNNAQVQQFRDLFNATAPLQQPVVNPPAPENPGEAVAIQQMQAAAERVLRDRQRRDDEARAVAQARINQAARRRVR